MRLGDSSNANDMSIISEVRTDHCFLTLWLDYKIQFKVQYGTVFLPFVLQIKAIGGEKAYKFPTQCGFWFSWYWTEKKMMQHNARELEDDEKRNIDPHFLCLLAWFEGNSKIWKWLLKEAEICVFLPSFVTHFSSLLYILIFLGVNYF